MQREELKRLAEGGNLQAIGELARQLFQENKIMESCEWARKGAEAGDVFCMSLAVPLLNISARALTKVAGAGEAANAMEELLLAEKWGNQLNKMNILKEPLDLSGTYAEMARCNFLLGLSTDNLYYYEETVRHYHMIKTPCQSEYTYVYYRALDELGRTDGLIEKKKDLIQNHDDTLVDYMIAALCADVSYAYLQGKGVSADYDMAKQYARIAIQYDPEDEFADKILNGEFKAEFDRVHGRRYSMDSASEWRKNKKKDYKTAKPITSDVSQNTKKTSGNSTKWIVIVLGCLGGAILLFFLMGNIEPKSYQNDNSVNTDINDFGDVYESDSIDLQPVTIPELEAIDLYRNAKSQLKGVPAEWCYDDFDGDGIKEMFIQMQLNEDEYYMNVEYALWFLGEEKIQCIIESATAWWLSPGDILVVGNKKFLVLSARHGYSSIWGVQNGVAKEVEIWSDEYFYYIVQEENGIVYGSDKFGDDIHTLEFDTNNFVFRDISE